MSIHEAPAGLPDMASTVGIELCSGHGAEVRSGAFTNEHLYHLSFVVGQMSLATAVSRDRAGKVNSSFANLQLPTHQHALRAAPWHRY